MKKLERILIALSAVSIVFEFLSINGGALLTMISLMLLCFFYYIFSFALFNNISFREMFRKASYRGISTLRIVGSVLTGFVLPVVLTGILYNVLGWIGGDNLVIAGILPCAVVLAIAAYKFFRSRDGFYQDVLWRIGLISAVGLMFLIV
jgi:hypothetical protein